MSEIVNKFLDSFLGSTDKWELAEVDRVSSFDYDVDSDDRVITSNTFWFSLKNNSDEFVDMYVSGFLFHLSVSGVDNHRLIGVHIIGSSEYGLPVWGLIKENEYKEEYKFLTEYVRNAVLMKEECREKQDMVKLNEVMAKI